MDIRLLSSAEDIAAYDRWEKSHHHGTLWQSLEWKTYQEALGRGVRIYAAWENDHIAASALVSIDRTSFGLSTWDIPRGPLGDDQSSTELLTHIETEAQDSRCLALFLSPCTPLSHLPTEALAKVGRGMGRGWGKGRHEQAQATRLLDLTASEEEILKQMKPKGRYNIAIARKHGVRVEQSEDIAAFYGLLKQTGNRDAFGIHPQRHYEVFLKNLPWSFLLLAYTSGKDPVAGLLDVTWNNTGIYYYGASDYNHRALMAPYLLQWEAMKFCKERGCTTYDLLGIAPPDAKPDHPWTGVSGFKEKFGGTIVMYPEEQQIVLRPMLSMLLQMKRKLWK